MRVRPGLYNSFMHTFIFALSLAPVLAFAALPDADYASVTAIRGTVKLVLPSGETALQQGQKVPVGATLVSGNQSFARLELADHSAVTVAPNTRMKIEITEANSPQLWQLVKGKIRSQIVHDPDQSGEKLIIRAGNAAMGVRGTDFVVSFEPGNQRVSLVTVSGNVAMAFVPPGGSAQQALSGGRVVEVKSGSFSNLSAGSQAPSAPKSLPPAQLQQFRKNDSAMPTFRPSGEPAAVAPVAGPKNEGAKEGNGPAKDGNAPVKDGNMPAREGNAPAKEGFMNRGSGGESSAPPGGPGAGNGSGGEKTPNGGGGLSGPNGGGNPNGSAVGGEEKNSARPQAANFGGPPGAQTGAGGAAGVKSNAATNLKPGGFSPNTFSGAGAAPSAAMGNSVGIPKSNVGNPGPGAGDTTRPPETGSNLGKAGTGLPASTGTANTPVGGTPNSAVPPQGQTGPQQPGSLPPKPPKYPQRRPPPNSGN